MAQTDIILEDDRWLGPDLNALADTAFAQVFRELSLDASFEVSLMGCDDARIAALNGDFRGKPSPTNVLSWPSEDRSPEAAGGVPDRPDMSDPELGDIAISFDTCQREAAEQGKPFNAHITHLLVHGLLHLLGYDHETDQDAALMEAIETRVLAKLGIEDPY